jgi:hypothetical protein
VQRVLSEETRRPWLAQTDTQTDCFIPHRLIRAIVLSFVTERMYEPTADSSNETIESL